MVILTVAMCRGLPAAVVDTTVTTGTQSAVIADVDASTQTRLVKNGDGTYTLDRANTYTGGTLLNGGILSVSATDALGSGPLTGAGTLSNAAAATTTFSNDASGFSGTYRTNSGWTILSGTSSASSSATYDPGGAGFALLAASGGTYTMGMISGSNVYGSVNPSTANTPNGCAFYLEVGGSGLSGTYAGKIVNASSGGHTIAVRKVGSGTWTLTGDSSNYSGGTEVRGGILRMGDGGTTGSVPGTITLNADANQTATAAWNYSEAKTVSNPLKFTTAGTLSNLGAEVKLTGNMTAADGTAVTLRGGTIELASHNTGFNGDLVIENCVAKMLDDGVGTAEGFFVNYNNTASITVKNGGELCVKTFDYQGSIGELYCDPPGLLLDGGTIRVLEGWTDGLEGQGGKSTRRFTVTENGGAFLFDGEDDRFLILVKEAAGSTYHIPVAGELRIGGAGDIRMDSYFTEAGSLKKVDAGTLTLTNASHTFSGGTTVEAGTLELASGVKLASAVTVGTGGTLKIAADSNATITGNLDLNGVLELELVNGDVGMLTVTGNVDFTDLTSVVFPETTLSDDAFLPFLTWGTINGFPHLQSIFAESVGLGVRLVQDGNTLKITGNSAAVPEPGTWGMMVWGMVCGYLFLRKRRVGK